MGYCFEVHFDLAAFHLIFAPYNFLTQLLIQDTNFRQSSLH